MIKLYYSSESSVGKQSLGYVDASSKEILAIDVTKTNVTGTQWKDLATHLGVTIGDLIDKEHPAFVKNYDTDTSLDENGWIKVLNNNPEVLNYPIMILGEKHYQIENPSDIEKLLETNSKGIDEKKHI
ncbi:arsenate reductase family protein [Psychroserpens sp. Hel_I_66]|uniref:arsenate reductase family protein n=1 Tax=Psychroserpens sp. Hel_I_66 TaxID=1250004 RepID=UPI000A886AC8|nr:hypothetical protein [Psychroserpens sp. Hel_I_66]